MAEKRAFVRNAGDPKQVKRATETSARKAARERDEWRQAAESQASARVLWRILAFCGMDHTSIARDNVGRIDTHQVAINEGQRNVGLFVKKQLFEADPDAYLRMEKDAAKIEEGIQEPQPRSADPLEVDEDDGN